VATPSSSRKGSEVSHASTRQDRKNTNGPSAELEKGRRFLRIMPLLWVYGRDEKLVSESLVRAKRLWEDCGYVMQEDRGILPILSFRRFL